MDAEDTAELAGGLIRRAAADIEGAFDRAVKRSGLTGRQIKALANLREKCVNQLDRYRDGHHARLPSAVLDEALDGIHRILTGDPKEAIAKSASGPGDRKAPGLHADGMIPASITGQKLEGEELVQACIALAKEFRDLAQSARKAMRNLGAEHDFDIWEKRYHKRIAEALHKQDLQTAEIEMAEARRSLNALIDQAQVDAALDKAAPSESAPLIPNFRN